MSIGAILALLVLVAAFVLFVVGRMDGIESALFAALAIAILLAPFPLGWPGRA